MSFAAIEGHEKPVTILKRALSNKTLAHAYLFSGEAGIGKKMTALALAAAVNCQNASEAGGCDVCPSCRKVATGGHPDIHLLVPDGEEIKIDQVRQVQSDLALKPFEGMKKTLIVDGVDRMNAASSNAFLKTLEEPPGEALIVSDYLSAAEPAADDPFTVPGNTVSTAFATDACSGAYAKTRAFGSRRLVCRGACAGKHGAGPRHGRGTGKDGAEPTDGPLVRAAADGSRRDAGPG